MIERQVNVVEWIANLVRDRCCEPSDNRAFLRLVQLRLELACASEFCSHLVERTGECAHLIESISRHLDVKITTRHFLRRGRELFDRASEAPDKETGDECGHEQNAERVKRRARRLSLQNVRERVRRVENDDDEAASFVGLNRKIESTCFTEVDVG